MGQIEQHSHPATGEHPSPHHARMKAGPELLQKASSRSASVLEHWPFSYRAMAVRAPTG